MEDREIQMLSDVELMYNITDQVDIFASDLNFELFVEGLSGKTKRMALSIIELYKRNKIKQAPLRVLSALDAFQIMAPRLVDLDVEEVWIIPLRNDNRIIGEPIKVSSGGRTSCIADKRVIFEKLITKKASAFILSHNHPSGYLKPSTPDDNLTSSLKECGKLLDIPLLDHVIIGKDFDNYYSYNENGRL